jgi:hypothetical protein
MIIRINGGKSNDGDKSTAQLFAEPIQSSVLFQILMPITFRVLVSECHETAERNKHSC